MRQRRLLRGVPVDHSTFHDEVHIGRRADVSDWISWHRHDVSLPAEHEDPDVVSSEQLGGNAGRGLECSHGREARRHHGLELQNAMAEGKHAAVRTVRDLYVTVCDQVLGLDDLPTVTAELPGRLTGQCVCVSGSCTR